VDILRNFHRATLQKKLFTHTIEINNAEKIIAAAHDDACHYLLFSSMVTRVFHSRQSDNPYN